MKRVLLAVAALGACSSPSAGVRVAEFRMLPTTSTTSTTSTTAAPSTTTSTRARASEAAAGTGPVAASGPSVPPPSTIAVPVSPPLNPPELVDAGARSPRAGGTTSASWYGDESGSHTATGERYDPDSLTFAHRTMPFGTLVRFCRAGACVVATCGDRGPAAWTGRDFDLSRATFAALAPLRAGVATVSWERLG